MVRVVNCETYHSFRAFVPIQTDFVICLHDNGRQDQFTGKGLHKLTRISESAWRHKYAFAFYGLLGGSKKEVTNFKFSALAFGNDYRFKDFLY